MNMVSISRPRVYLIDFEFAIEFSPESLAEERVCVGYPTSESALAELYKRPIPEEVFLGIPYDPFKLDMWQLGWTLANFKVCLSSIASTVGPDDDSSSLLCRRSTQFWYPSLLVTRLTAQLLEKLYRDFRTLCTPSRPNHCSSSRMSLIHPSESTLYVTSCLLACTN